MKKYVVMALFLFSFLSSSFAQKPKEPMVYYEYHVRNSFALWAEKYAAELKEDGTVQFIYGRSEGMVADEFGDTLTVDASEMKHIEDKYLEHKMYEYEERYRPEYDVTDGTGWGVTAVFGRSRSGRTLFSASGYEAWPEDDGLKIINSYIKSFFDEDNQVIGAYLLDKNGKYSNVRETPNGKVISRIPTSRTMQLYLTSQDNGWWKITNYWDTEDENYDGIIGGMIHYSCLGVSTRNYGGEKCTLRKEPNAESQGVYHFMSEMTLRPKQLSDDCNWLLVETIDKKFSGWIECEWICGNPVTNCI